MIAIEMQEGDLLRNLGTLGRAISRPVGVMKVAGRAAANLTRKHYRTKDQKERNKLSDRREHFWLQVMRSVQSPVINASGTRAVIGITHPAIAQKVFGGVIRAKRKRNLSIPVDPDAYGRAPSTFEAETGLELIFIKQNRHSLLATRVDGTDTLQVRYLLTPSVRQDKDPTALPEEKDLEAAVVKGALSAIDGQLRRQNLA